MAAPAVKMLEPGIATELNDLLETQSYQPRPFDLPLQLSRSPGRDHLPELGLCFTTHWSEFYSAVVVCASKASMMCSKQYEVSTPV